MVQNHAEDLARLRRVLPERAIALAMQSRWSEAADINRKIIELYPNDADAFNRLGKALMEMGRYRDALATYRRAIELDPNNIIAKKNVERLVHLADREPIEPPAPSQIESSGEGERLNPAIFIEETGKTGLTSLINLGEAPVLLKLAAGDRVDLRVENSALRVYDESGQLIGSVEPRLAKRLMGLMEGGNRYTAAVTTVSDQALTIIIRETYQDPTQRGRLSFPPKALPAGAYRPYMREGALRHGMEDDDDDTFAFEADEADVEETEESEDEVEFEEEDNDDEEEL
jgi:tetratricopeptide (TPR) repeat protein